MVILGLLSQFSWLHLDCFKEGITLSYKQQPQQQLSLIDWGLSCEEGGGAADVI